MKSNKSTKKEVIVREISSKMKVTELPLQKAPTKKSLENQIKEVFDDEEPLSKIGKTGLRSDGNFGANPPERETSLKREEEKEEPPMRAYSSTSTNDSDKSKSYQVGMNSPQAEEDTRRISTSEFSNSLFSKRDENLRNSETTNNQNENSRTYADTSSTDNLGNKKRDRSHFI
jgi:hypothetical protein